jgi:hypothetical protein
MRDGANDVLARVSERSESRSDPLTPAAAASVCATSFAIVTMRSMPLMKLMRVRTA